MDTRSSKVMIHFRKVDPKLGPSGGGGGGVLRISSDFLSGLVCSIVAYFYESRRILTSP